VRAAAKGVATDPSAADVCEQLVALCKSTPREPGAPVVPGPALGVVQCQQVLAAVACWSRWEAIECMAYERKATRCLLPHRWRVYEEISPSEPGPSRRK
jgi:hypothetical protein